MNRVVANKIKDLANYLIEAEKSQKPNNPLTEVEPDLTLDEAYEVQLQVVQEKLHF